MKRILCAVLSLALALSLCCAALAQDEAWICAQCGQENKAEYQFCPSCGASREAALSCPDCGYALSAQEQTFAFCPSCGYRLDDAAPQEETPFQSCPITVSEDLTFTFCDLPWNSGPDAIVATVEDVTGMHAYLNTSNIYDGLVCSPETVELFPGLSDDAYLPRINITPEADGTWWMEFQVSPADIDFASPAEAAEWFLRMWNALQSTLSLPAPSAVEVIYPDNYEGERTVRPTDAPETYLAAWAETVQNGIDELIIRIRYNNMTLTLEYGVYAWQDFTTCWIILEPTGV